MNHLISNFNVSLVPLCCAEITTTSHQCEQINSAELTSGRVPWKCWTKNPQFLSDNVKCVRNFTVIASILVCKMSTIFTDLNKNLISIKVWISIFVIIYSYTELSGAAGAFI